MNESLKQFRNLFLRNAFSVVPNLDIDDTVPTGDVDAYVGPPVASGVGQEVDQHVAESCSFGQTVFDYAPRSNGAADYTQLAAEILDDTVIAPTTTTKRNAAEAKARPEAKTKVDEPPSTAKATRVAQVQSASEAAGAAAAPVSLEAPNSARSDATAASA